MLDFLLLKHFQINNSISNIHYLNKIQITFCCVLFVTAFSHWIWIDFDLRFICGISWDDRKNSFAKDIKKCLNIKHPNAEMLEFVERKLIKFVGPTKKLSFIPSYEVLIEKRLFMSFKSFKLHQYFSSTKINERITIFFWFVRKFPLISID